MKGIIYIALNTYNGKRYIGQTRTSLEARKKQHFSDARRRSDVNHFHHALLQYGESGFEWSVLEKFEGSKEDVIHMLNVAEEYHILKNKTRISENGYNATQGGYGSDKFERAVKRKTCSKAVWQYDLDGNFIREYESISEVCREFGIKARHNFVARGMWRGFQWRFKGTDVLPTKISAYVRPRRSSKVLVYTSDGKFYKESESINRCKSELGYSFALRKLSDSVSIQQHSIGKMLVFRKRGEDYPKEIQVNIIMPKSKGKIESAEQNIPVLQYSRDGKFIKEFPSILSAERETGICKQSIRLWCRREDPLVIRGKNMTKYLWRYKRGEITKDIDVQDYVVKDYESKMEHRVLQYDRDGKFIKVWKNIYQASICTGDSTNLIKKQCSGRHTRKTPAFVWRCYSETYPHVLAIP